MPLQNKDMLRCSICGYESDSFQDYKGQYYILGELKDHYTKNAICPGCKSDMRHRFVFKFLTNQTDFCTNNLKLIHFAPEKWLATKICCMDNIDYIPVDISPFNFDYLNVQYSDITRLPFDDDTFDALIMVHVLEHIPDDAKAIQEMYRVLKNGGWAVIAVPTIGKHTHFDPALSANERNKMYGIDEHYRLYGTDLADKLNSAGLHTRVFEFSDIGCDFADLDQSSPHIDSDKYIFYCRKNAEPVIQTEASTDHKDTSLSVCGRNIDKTVYDKTENKPKLSIITVTYNAESVLEKTLLSIFCQTFHDYELIVIDGNSSDSTVNIIRRYPDHISHWVSEPDDGIYDAMNKGLSIARGDYVQFLNAGDYYCDNDVLNDIFSSVEDMPTLIYGDINILGTNRNVTYQRAGEFSLDELLARGTGVLCHQAMFVKRIKAPLYNCKYKYKAELNWYFDILESEGFSSRHVQRPVVFYSLGGFGYNNFIRNRLEWIWLIFRRYGLVTLFKSRIIIFLIKNSVSRYPLLYNSVKLIKQPSLLFKKQ